MGYDYWDSFDCQIQCEEFFDETQVDEDEVEDF